MKALSLCSPEHLEWENIPDPEILSPHEVLCETLAVGICGTDFHAFAGRQPMMSYPRILGHELAVKILEVGSSVSNVQPGQQGCVEPFLNCGHCSPCETGKYNCCVDLKVLGVHVDGGLRPRFKIPAQKFHSSEALEPSQLATAEPLTIGLHAVRRSNVQPDQKVLILGLGPIGMALMPPLLEAKAQIWVADVNDFRLQNARNGLGLTEDHCLVLPKDKSPEECSLIISDMTDCLGFDVVFDATGFIGSMNQAPTLAAHGGEVIFVGHTQGEIRFPNPLFHQKELRISASRNSTSVDFNKVLSMLETEGSFWNQLNWITHRIPFAETKEWFPELREPASNCVKAIIEFDPE